MKRQVVARAIDVAPGQCKIVTVNGREIGVFNLDGEYFALANRCPHEGGPLCQGKIIALVQSDGPGHYRLARHERIPALPVARLGVRHPHRAVLVRSEVDPGPAVRGDGRIRARRW